MTLTDTHAHIHFDEFAADIAEVLERARRSRIASIICVGTSIEDSRSALTFVQKHSSEHIGLYATSGIHPHEATAEKSHYQELVDLVQQNVGLAQFVAIGECGLDYYKNFSSKQDQWVMLEQQLQLATQYELPVVFHVRDAWQDFFALLKDYSTTRGVIHSFTGHTDVVEQALAYGLYFGINGIMTFTKDTAQLDALKAIPLDKLLLETDCPYLSPVPHRGKRNEPAYLQDTALFVATTKQIDEDRFTKQVQTNAEELFGI